MFHVKQGGKTFNHVIVSLIVNQVVFLRALEHLQIHLCAKQTNQFVLYHEHLQEWTQRVSLVSKNDRSKIWERHFLDSLTAVPLIGTQPSRLLDLGSGAGFPGVPIKIAIPRLDVVLLEFLLRKHQLLLLMAQ